MKVKLLPLVEIKPYWRNPRQNDKSIEAVKKSITEFGFNQPLVLDTENTIIVGHARYRAALALELPKVPCVIVDLPSEKVKAYRIADNKAAEFAEWDPVKLTMELKEIGGLADMAAYFQGDELAQLMSTVQTIDTAAVTQSEVEKRQETLDRSMEQRSGEEQAKYVEVPCPHCGKSFFIDREELMRERASPVPPADAKTVTIAAAAPPPAAQ